MDLAKRAVEYALHDTFGYNDKHHIAANVESFFQHLRREGYTVVKSDLLTETWRAGYNAGVENTYDAEGYADNDWLVEQG